MLKKLKGQNILNQKIIKNDEQRNFDKKGNEIQQ